MIKTPAAVWRERGEKDPFGEQFASGIDRISMSHLSHIDVATMLLQSHKDIHINTIAKERIRWLSRKVVSIIGDADETQYERASLTLGEYTDDALANAVFTETNGNADHPWEDYRNAAAHRIEWLTQIIETYQNENKDMRS